MQKVGLRFDYAVLRVVSVRCSPLTVDSGDFSLLCFQPEAVRHSFTPSLTVLPYSQALATDNFNRTAQYDTATQYHHNRTTLSPTVMSPLGLQRIATYTD